MQIAIVLFEHCTALDAVGPYEVLSRWPNAEVHMVGERKGPVRTDTEMLALHVDATYDEVPEPDIIMVPGAPHMPSLETPDLVVEALDRFLPRSAS